MTGDELEALLRLLSPDREEAAQKYETIRRRLIRFFEWRGCDIPEELADETIDRVARKISKDVTPNREDPYPYFRGVATNIHREHLRRKLREQRVVDETERPSPPTEEEEEDRRLASLRHCLGELSQDEQRLLLRYHQGENNIRTRKELCTELGQTMNALRIRVHRLRRKVETCVEEHLRG